MLAALLSLFAVDRLVAFMIGLATYWLAVRIADYRRDRRDPEGRPHRTHFSPVMAFGGIAVIVCGIIGAGTYENWQCGREFNESIRASRALGLENDRLSREQRAALGKSTVDLALWIHALIAPPPDIAKLDPNDPVRYRYSTAVTDEFFAHLQDTNEAIAASQEQERRNDDERRAHPLPEPNCGR